MWPIQLALFTQLSKYLRGFLRISPHVVAMAVCIKQIQTLCLSAESSQNKKCSPCVSDVKSKLMLTESRWMRCHRWLCIYCKNDSPDQSWSLQSGHQCQLNPSQILTPSASTPLEMWPLCQRTLKRVNYFL